jgi:hypothetical protein
MITVPHGNIPLNKKLCKDMYHGGLGIWCLRTSLVFKGTLIFPIGSLAQTTNHRSTCTRNEWVL